MILQTTPLHQTHVVMYVFLKIDITHSHKCILCVFVCISTDVNRSGRELGKSPTGFLMTLGSTEYASLGTQHGEGRFSLPYKGHHTH